MKSWKIHELGRRERLPLTAWENLRCHSAELLKNICTSLGLEMGKKAEMARGIADFLSDEKRLSPLLNDFDREDLALLNVMARHSPETSTPMMFLREAHFSGISSAKNRLLRLILHGLILVRWYEGTSEVLHQSEIEEMDENLDIFIPALVLELMPQVETPGIEFDDPGEPDEADIRKPKVFQTLRAIDLVLGHVAETPLELTKNGKIKKAAVKRMVKEISPLFPMMDNERAYNLLQIAYLTGALEMKDRESGLRLGEKGEALLKLPPLERLENFWAATKSERFNFMDLDYFSMHHKDVFLHYKRNYGDMVLAVTEDWPVIPDVLRLMPVKKWVRIRDLIRYAGSGYPFLFFRLERYSHWGRTAPPESPLDVQTRIQEIVFTGYIEEIAFPFGLVEWSIGKEKELLIRMTGLGRRFLGMADPPKEIRSQAKRDKARAIVVQPDFEIVAFNDGLDFDDRLRLWEMAVPEAEHDSQDPVSRFRLSRQSVSHCLDRGMTLEEILDFLEAENGGPLPRNVAIELGEWSRMHDQVVFFRGFDLLQFKDGEERDKNAVEYPGAKNIGDCFLMAREGPVSSTRVVDYSSTLGKCLKIDKNGRVTLQKHIPADLETLGLLEMIAESGSPGLFRLSDKAVKAAPIRGKELVAMLDARSTGLPSTVYMRIMGLGGGVKPFPFNRFHLLEINDSRILNGILEDPATGKYAAGTVGGNLLAILPGQSAAFEKALAKTGLALDSGASPSLKKKAHPPDQKKDLSGFRLVQGRERRKIIMRAIESGKEMDIMYFDKPSRYGSSRLEVVRCLPLEIVDDYSPYLLAREIGDSRDFGFELRTIKAIRELG